MKPNRTATRIFAGVLPATALLVTPAFAQDVAQTAPVIQPAPMPDTVPSPPTTGTASSADRAKYEASVAAATGNADVSAQVAPEREVRRAPTRPASRAVQPRRPAVVRPARAAAVTAPVVPAPTATATTPAATPSPTATAATPTATGTPLPDAPMTTPVPEETTPVATTTTETTTTRSRGVPVWAWILGGLVLIGLLFAFLRRGRREETWDEPVAAEPVHEERVVRDPVAPAAPLAAAAAPVVAEEVAEHAEVVNPAADEVAAITGAAAPVAGRPWIELSLRPVRAGTIDDSATVELELTLANAGEEAARNVRVTTFMLGDAAGAPTAIDQLLSTGHGGAEVDAGDIAAGEGSRVDATLAAPLAATDGATFQPVVIADVRYALPGGGEGRTAAAFAIGVDDGAETLAPLRSGGDLRDDIAAMLHGVPERA